MGEGSPISDALESILRLPPPAPARRPVVTLRVPLALGQAAVSYVPGLDADDAARVRDALARGITGPILEVRDEDGDGVRLRLQWAPCRLPRGRAGAAW